MISRQLALIEKKPVILGHYRERLVSLLSEDLDFHGQSNGFKSHNFHSFPAKFPPQLPRKFINELTLENEVVLDPMSGSGTTVVEALLSRRQGIGFDIDPLAIKIASVKITALEIDLVVKTGNEIIQNSRAAYNGQHDALRLALINRWDAKTKEFIDYWFAAETQIELLALVFEIEKIANSALKAFFELVLSATIITKSGGVSLALDLGHTRPHKAKLIVSKTGRIIVGEKTEDDNGNRHAFLTKILRSAFDEFEKRLKNNLDGLIIAVPKKPSAEIAFGNAESIPLPDNYVDLIVTSPPYASNAIDYMRAHKFSLVWFGYTIEDLSEKRKEYIGAEATTNVTFEQMPPSVDILLANMTQIDAKKSLVIRRYYSEMTRVLKEMFRLLKPGKAAIVVIGSSIIRGIDTETQICLADIGKMIGFEVPKIGIRNLDRNKRMLPAGAKVNADSQIQQRMHQEYVIGFYKP
jgi:DNA modification methylase